MRAVWRAREAEVAVNGGDHDVERGKGVVRKIQRAVLQDVDLDALEYAHAPQPGIQAVDGHTLPREARCIEAVGHGLPAGVLGDRDVGEPLLLRRRDHGLEGVVSVGLVGVHVEVAREVGPLHQRRQLAALCRLDLAAVLAQLRGDPRQADRSVHRLL